MAAPRLDVSMAAPAADPTGPTIDARTIFKLLMKEKLEVKTEDGHVIEHPKYTPEQAYALANKAMDIREGRAAGEMYQDDKVRAEGGAARAVNMLAGVTGEFDDELAGAMDAVKAKAKGQDATEAYRQGRDARRETKKAGEEYDTHPIVSKAVGAMALAPMLPGGAGWAGAAKTGLGYGAVVGAGNSNADLTRGEVADAGIDTGIGAVTGMVAGLVGHGVVQGAGRVGRLLLDKGAEALGLRSATQSAARNVAAKVAEDAAQPASAGVGRGQTVAGATAAGNEIERDVTSTLQQRGLMMGKERFRLKPSQLTGQRDAALSEKLAQESPQTMNHAQLFVSKQLDHAEKFIDTLVDDVAANPGKLGTQQLTDEVTGGLTNFLQGMHRSRSVATKPVYDLFEKAGGYMPESEFRAGILGAVKQDNRFVTEPVTKRLNAIVDHIVDEASKIRARSGVANEDAQLSIQAVNDVRKFLVKVTRQEADLGVEGMSPTNQKRIASIALDGIDSAFDNIVAHGDANPANAQAAQAVGYLREANALWKSHTTDIRSAATKTVRRLIDASGEDTAEGIVDRIGTMSRSQIRGVFDALTKADAEAGTTVAQDLRSQIWLNRIERGGKTPRGAVTSRKYGTSELPAFGIMREMERGEGALREVFRGDPKALVNFERVQRMLQRLSFGPNIKGSPTVPLALAEGERLAQTGLEGMGRLGRTAAWGLQMAGKLTGSTQATAEAFSTAEGLDAFGQALQIQILAATGRPVSQAMSSALQTAMRRAGLDAYADFQTERRKDLPAEPTDDAVAGEPYQ